MAKEFIDAARRLFFWGGAFILASCATTPDAKPQAQAIHEFSGRQPPAWLDLREASQDPKFQLGDCAVFSLRLRRGDQTKSWFVIATVAANKTTATNVATVRFTNGRTLEEPLRGRVRYHVRVTDPDGTLIDESLSEFISADGLRFGLAPVAAFAIARPGLTDDNIEAPMIALDPEERRAVVISLTAVHALVKLVLDNTSLAPLLQECVRRPTWTSLLTKFMTSTKIVFDIPGARSWQGPLPIPETEAFEVPLQVEAFDEIVLLGSALVARSAAPIHLGAGILSLTGTHPDRPDHNAKLELIGFGRHPPAEVARILIMAAESTPR